MAFCNDRKMLLKKKTKLCYTSDCESLEEREAGAISRLGGSMTPSLIDAIRQHSQCRDDAQRRRDLRVWVAVANFDQGVSTPEDVCAFQRRVVAACTQLDLGEAVTTDTLSCFTKAALYRIDPTSQEGLRAANATQNKAKAIQAREPLYVRLVGTPDEITPDEMTTEAPARECEPMFISGISSSSSSYLHLEGVSCSRGQV